jgi:GT2 family glycosyltransferase
MKISVIIATYNRGPFIIECLNSVATALLAATPVQAEIIIVDNGSTDDTGELIRGWVKTSPVPGKFLLETRRGTCHARNLALKEATGDVLAFTDHDCRWSETYVVELLAHLAQDKAPVLRGGRVEKGDPKDLPLTTKTSLEKKRWSKAQNSARQETLGLCLIGCNMTMTRELLERIGPFDKRFGSKGISAAEDTDLVFRCYVAGIAIEYVPDMLVYHHHGRRTVEQAYQTMCKYSIGNGALYAKYAFKDVDLIRPAVWDLRNAIKEFRSGGNNLMAKYNFSYRSLIRYYLVGAWRFYTYPFRRAA